MLTPEWQKFSAIFCMSDFRLLGIDLYTSSEHSVTILTNDELPSILHQILLGKWRLCSALDIKNT